MPSSKVNRFCGRPTFENVHFLSDTLANESDICRDGGSVLRGELVIVRTFGGKLVECRVWDVGEAVVYVTNDEEFDKLIAGKPALDPIGFPKEDIFCRPASKSARKRLRGSQLNPWQG